MMGALSPSCAVADIQYGKRGFATPDSVEGTLLATAERQQQGALEREHLNYAFGFAEHRALVA